MTHSSPCRQVLLALAVFATGCFSGSKGSTATSGSAGSSSSSRAASSASTGCTPSCSGAMCGAPDGCGGFCQQNCGSSGAAQGSQSSGSLGTRGSTSASTASARSSAASSASSSSAAAASSSAAGSNSNGGSGTISLTNASSSSRSSSSSASTAGSSSSGSSSSATRSSSSSSRSSSSTGSSGSTGTVCPGKEILCGGLCINPQTDSQFCGASGACSTDAGSAGVDCGSGKLCVNGACATSCPPGEVDCGGKCIDPTSDRQFCGASGSCSPDAGTAGATCTAGTLCANGVCSTTCPPGEIDCLGTCVDPRTSPQFCGASGSCSADAGTAGEACPAGEVCGNGACNTSCPGGEVDCTGLCVDPTSDPNHCGASGACSPDAGTQGKVCPSGQVCGNGKCQVSCPAGEVDCGGKCIDPTANNSFCGASGNCQADGGSPGVICPSGQVCGNGACNTSCPGGEIDCGGQCVDPNTDREFCGASGNCQADGGSAGKICAAGAVCSNGVCATSCPQGEVDCGGRCIDPSNDPVFCGAIGNCHADGGSAGATCGAGEVCASGTCTTSCPPGQLVCGVLCVDPNTDLNFCGAQGNCQTDGGSPGQICGPGQVCANGSCTTNCPQGEVVCGGKCRDPSTDLAFCGASGNCQSDGGSPGVACLPGEVCASGMCTTSCPLGELVCGGTCVDPDTDLNFCGAQGNCQTDGGSPGVICAPGQVCAGGGCITSCPSGEVDCGGKCIDPTANNTFCGATAGCGEDGGSAGITCLPGQVCSASGCATSCPTGEVDCNGQCINPFTDPVFCGATAGCGEDGGSAGQPCGNGLVCGNGVCQTSCPAGEVDCNNKCFDPGSNNLHCGATPGCGVDGGSAGTACSAGQVCTGGRCSLSCQAGFVDCAGLCVDPTSDNSFCGASGSCNPADGGSQGVTCSNGFKCANSICVANCPSGELECNLTCVNPLSDRQFCGARGNCAGANAGVTCAPGAVCADGGCVVSCPSSEIDCSGTCVNPLVDANNCGLLDAGAGSCGNVCATALGQGATCVVGSCQCPKGDNAVCGGACTDTLADPNNCSSDGGCGNACGAGQVCSAGSCQTSCLSSELQCGSSCVNPLSDDGNCGFLDGGAADGGQACGDVCSASFGQGSSCVAGACTCPKGDNAVCGGACTNTLSDPGNCSTDGSCGNGCGSGQVCSSGVCQTSCLASQLQCGNSCVSPLSDDNNCGFLDGGTATGGQACGDVCSSAYGVGSTCQGGACTCPESDNAVCGGTCTNTGTDFNNCGSCGNSCSSISGSSCQPSEGPSQCACPASAPTACGVDGVQSQAWNASSSSGNATEGANSGGGANVEQFTYSDASADASADGGQSFTFQASATQSGSFQFNWTYQGNHGVTGALAGLAAFSTGANGTLTTVTLVSPQTVSGAFTFSGSSSLTLAAGQTWGFAAAGQTADASPQLSGTVTLAQQQSCSDTQTDPNNCGGCGNVCVYGACFQGSCLCPQGETFCPTGEGVTNAGVCVPNGNCQCVGQGDGTSCGISADLHKRTLGPSQGPSCCGQICVDTSSDTSNCSGCGIQCAAGDNCCAGSCSNPSTDGSNCNGCFNACPATSPACSNGACGAAASPMAYCSDLGYETLDSACSCPPGDPLCAPAVASSCSVAPDTCFSTPSAGTCAYLDPTESWQVSATGAPGTFFNTELPDTQGMDPTGYCTDCSRYFQSTSVVCGVPSDVYFRWGSDNGAGLSINGTPVYDTYLNPGFCSDATCCALCCDTPGDCQNSIVNNAVGSGGWMSLAAVAPTALSLFTSGSNTISWQLTQGGGGMGFYTEMIVVYTLADGSGCSSNSQCASGICDSDSSTCVVSSCSGSSAGTNCAINPGLSAVEGLCDTAGNCAYPGCAGDGGNAGSDCIIDFTTDAPGHCDTAGNCAYLTCGSALDQGTAGSACVVDASSDEGQCDLDGDCAYTACGVSGTADAGPGSFCIGTPRLFDEGLCDSSANCVVAACGLEDAVSWYPAEGSANDSLGLNNGTINGSVGFTAGEVGQAFYFDGGGNGNFVSATTTNFPTGDADRTVEGWVRFDNVALNPYQAVFAYGAPNPGQLFGVALQNDQLLVDYMDAAVEAPTTLSQGVPHHFAAVSAAGTIILYVDGMNVASAPVTLSTPAGSTLYIGQNPAAVAVWGDTEMDGFVDELTVYSRALSAKEILAIYSAGANGKPLDGPRTPCYADANLNEGTCDSRSLCAVTTCTANSAGELCTLATGGEATCVSGPPPACQAPSDPQHPRAR